MHSFQKALFFMGHVVIKAETTSSENKFLFQVCCTLSHFVYAPSLKGLNISNSGWNPGPDIDWTPTTKWLNQPYYFSLQALKYLREIM